MSDGAIMATVIIGVIVVIASVIGGLTMFANWSNDVGCHARWGSEYQPQYGWWSGCTIVVEGHRIPSASYRVL